MRRTRLLDKAHALVECLDRTVGTDVPDQCVGARELDERHGNRAMLGCSRGREQMSPDRHRQQQPDIDVVIGDIGAIGALDVAKDGRGPEDVSTWHRATDGTRMEMGGGRCAHDDLSGTRDGLHFGGHAGAGAADDQLAVARRVADEEELESSAVDSDRHPQGHLSGRGVGVAHVPQNPSHPVGGSHGAHRVVVAPEEQQYRVTAPLDEVRAVRASGDEQRTERRVEDVTELLRTGPSAARESLGQLREPGDVEECERAVDGPMALLRVPTQPLDGELRYIRLQRAHCPLRARSLHRSHLTRRRVPRAWLPANGPGTITACESSR